MNVLWCVFTLGGVCDGVEASVWKEVPACLGLVSEEDVGSVVPSEPSGDFVAQVEDLIGGLFVQPMVHGRIEVVSEGGDLLWEFPLKPRENIVELQRVGVQVHPPRMGRKYGQGLPSPQTVG